MMLLPSSLVPFDGKVDQSKRARVKEHRLSSNIIGLVCAGREHKDWPGYSIPRSRIAPRG